MQPFRTQEDGPSTRRSVGRLIDVPLSKRRAREWKRPEAPILLAVTLAIVAFATLNVFYLKLSTPWVLGVVAVLALPAIVISARSDYRARRQTHRELLRSLRADGMTEGVRLLFERDPPGDATCGPMAERVLRYLMRRGYRGSAIRVCPPERSFAVSPLDVAVEARPLCDGEVTFEELRTALGAEDRPMDVPSRLWRIIRHAPGWMVVAAWVINMTLLRPVTGPGFGWTIFWGLGLWLAVVVTIWGLVTLRAWFRRKPKTEEPDQAAPWELWMIVQGGVLFRWAEGERWRVRVVDRESAILLIYVDPMDKHKWRSVVYVSPNEQYERSCSEAECKVLLMAWLSPIRPPTEATFSDWTVPV